VNRGRPALEVIGERLPNTLLLMIPAEIVIILGALLVGIYSALRQYSFLDHAMTALSFVGYSMPIFFIALISMYIFAVLFKRWGLPHLPTVGMFDPLVGETPLEVARHMVLPVFSIATISLAGYSRYIRSTMLEVLNQDYIRTARAKGQGERKVVYKHALRNMMVPLLTIIGVFIAIALTGTVLTETVFTRPGLGKMLVDAIGARDYPLAQGAITVFTMTIIVVNLVVDMLYAVVDPRISYR
jgi:peptide/nickel transport system permease protein